MLYVLIVLWWPASINSGKAAFSQEFNSAQACERARVQVLAMERHDSDGITYLRAICVPKE